MANPYHHALSSAKRFGGIWEDYIAIHNWFDESKKYYADIRHRALRHHSEGIAMAESVFGGVFQRKSDQVMIPTRFIGEQHVKEDLGFIPTVQDWFKNIKTEKWMVFTQKEAKKVMKRIEVTI